MKHFPKPLLFSALILLLGFSFTTKAQKNVEYIFPTATFNAAETYKMLDEGTSSIQGNVSLKKRGYVNYPGLGVQVMLYPVTPYLLEYIELKKKYNSKKKQAAITKDAALARIQTKTIDEKGNFEFRNLKPGKYYIVTWIIWEKVTANRVQSGPVQTGQRNMLGIVMGSGFFPTEIRNDATAYENEVGEFVEVADNKKITTVNIAK